jgi:flagellar hook assembly protein FlgD
MTTIKFQVPSSKSQITMSIYDVTGKVVMNFNLKSEISNLQSAISWNGVDNSGNRVPPGIYFCRLRVDDKALTTKVIKLVD